MLPQMLPTSTCQQNAAKCFGFLVPFWVLLALNSVCNVLLIDDASDFFSKQTK